MMFVLQWYYPIMVLIYLFLISCLWSLASCIWIWFDIHENSSILIYQNTPNFLRNSSFEESYAQNGFFDFHYATNLVSLFFYRYETHFLLQGQPRQIFVVPKISVSKKSCWQCFCSSLQQDSFRYFPLALKSHFLMLNLELTT